ncbi:hypothetical protein QN277_009620 [Acacia crassicarpa]|uniref:Uncharacterized protein n=1 Tax=Acacia crassicarpa TaxID=499986 RepID=A0AAE1IPF2_9FABA|nr:hypothetical protein QN277_009620 [Acacia crassicarpa]
MTSMHAALHGRNLKTMLLYYNRKWVSTVSAVATDSLEATDSIEKEHNEKNEKVVLPTNESSQRLLRIRHTLLD